MASVSEILAAANARGIERKLGYEGELMPSEAYELTQHLPAAKLVDVRTRAEWDFVGRIPGALEIEWESYPEGNPNPRFLEQLKQRVPPDAPVLFICRSGNRSHHA